MAITRIPANLMPIRNTPSSAEWLGETVVLYHRYQLMGRGISFE